MSQLFLIMVASLCCNICQSCFEDVPMSPTAHFGGLKHFTDLYATQPKIFAYKPAYSKRMFGTKAEEYSPLHLYLTPITKDCTESFMEARLETLHKALTNSHLKTRQVGSVEIELQVSEGKEALLKSMKEIYTLIQVLRNDDSFPYIDREEFHYYPISIKFEFTSSEDPAFIERFYKPNSQHFAVCGLPPRPSRSGLPQVEGERKYHVTFCVLGFSHLKLGDVFTEPFERYVESPLSEGVAQASSEKEEAAAPPKPKPRPRPRPALPVEETAPEAPKPRPKALPAGGVPVHPGREGFTRPVDFLPDRPQPSARGAAADAASAPPSVSKLAQQMERAKFD